MFAAYKWVIGKRKNETFNYMKSRIDEKKQADKDRSCMAKCGSLIKTMMIYGTVAAVVIPMIYSLYTSMKADNEQEERMENMKPPRTDTMSEEDITKAAMEREA